jgi:hypothetical protein
MLRLKRVLMNIVNFQYFIYDLFNFKYPRLSYFSILPLVLWINGFDCNDLWVNFILILICIMLWKNPRIRNFFDWFLLDFLLAKRNSYIKDCILKTRHEDSVNQTNLSFRRKCKQKDLEEKNFNLFSFNWEGNFEEIDSTDEMSATKSLRSENSHIY